MRKGRRSERKSSNGLFDSPSERRPDSGRKTGVATANFADLAARLSRRPRTVPAGPSAEPELTSSERSGYTPDRLHLFDVLSRNLSRAEDDLRNAEVRVLEAKLELKEALAAK
jgi:hypothetical protein